MLSAIKYIRKADGKEIYFQLEYVTKLEILQDIYNPQLMGELVVNDRESWQNIIPVLGDKLEIIFQKPIIPLTEEMQKKQEVDLYTYTFDVYKPIQLPIDLNSKPFRELIIYFTAGNMVSAYATSISKTFYKKTYNTIASELLRKVGVPFKFYDNCNTLLTYTAPLWCPIKTLTDISDYAISEDNKSAYLFFQDLNGVLQFITIPSLLEGKMGVYENTKYYNREQKKVLEENLSFKASNNNFNKILTMQYTRTPNYIKLANKGAFDTNYVYFDLEKNEVKSVNKNITDAKRLGTKLSEFIPIPKEELGNYTTNFSFGFPTSDYSKQYFKGFVETKLNRLLMDFYELEVTCNGYIDRKVGTLIKADIPTQLTSTKDNEEYDTPDTVYTGTYLIRAITHSFHTTRSYLQTLTLATDGVNSNEYNNNFMKW